MSETMPLRVRELAQRQADNGTLQITLWLVEGTLDTYVVVEDFKKKPPTRETVNVPSPDLAWHRFVHALAHTEEYGKSLSLYAGTEADYGRGTN